MSQTIYKIVSLAAVALMLFMALLNFEWVKRHAG